MSAEAMLWLAAAGVLLIGAALAGWQTLRQRAGRRTVVSPRWELVCITFGLLALCAGLGWRSWQSAIWPGGALHDSLALLAAGALIASAWRWAGRPAPARSLVLLGVGLVALSAAGVARQAQPAELAPQARTWLFGVRVLLAAIGLGGWLPVLAASIPWPGDVTAGEGQVSGASAIFRISYPCLTAAWLAGALWHVAAYATLWRGRPSDVWLVVSWLLGGAYLLVAGSTGSSDRLGNGSLGGLSRWAPAILAGGGLATALLSAIAAPGGSAALF